MGFYKSVILDSDVILNSLKFGVMLEKEGVAFAGGFRHGLKLDSDIILDSLKFGVMLKKEGVAFAGGFRHGTLKLDFNFKSAKVFPLDGLISSNGFSEASKMLGNKQFIVKVKGK